MAISHGIPWGPMGWYSYSYSYSYGYGYSYDLWWPRDGFCVWGASGSLISLIFFSDFYCISIFACFFAYFSSHFNEFSMIFDAFFNTSSKCKICLSPARELDFGVSRWAPEAYCLSLVAFLPAWELNFLLIQWLSYFIVTFSIYLVSHQRHFEPMWSQETAWAGQKWSEQDACPLSATYFEITTSR